MTSGAAVLAISVLVKDVAIPLLAAAVTAAGIVVPLWVQRDRDRKAEAVAYEKALRSIHRDAAFLVEQVQLVGLRRTKNETVSTEQLAATTTASRRLSGRLFDDPRIFDSYFHGADKPQIASESKLLLLLGEFEVRLENLATAPNVFLPLFVASLLAYVGEENEQERDQLRGAMELIIENDEEVKALASAVVPSLLGD